MKMKVKFRVKSVMMSGPGEGKISAKVRLDGKIDGVGVR